MKHKSFRKFDLFFFFVTVILILIFAAFTKAQSDQTSEPKIAASGGAFTLEKAVTAGGAAKQGAMFNEHGTTGQSIAGIKSSDEQFSLFGGFWTAEDFAPTAAGVTVGGRIKTAAGRGIRNVRIIVTFSSGETRETLSGAAGFYQFIDIPAGETCIFSVSASRYVFDEPAQIRNIMDDTHDVDFVTDGVKPGKTKLLPP